MDRNRRGTRDGKRDVPETRDGKRRAPGVVDSSPLGEAVVAGDAFGAATVAGGPVTVEANAVTATLVGVPLVDVRELAYTHRIDPARLEAGETTQPIALFDLHNVSGVPIQWVCSRAQFLGDDGYTYRPARLPIDPAQLGPGIHARRVDVQPDRRARVATLVEQLPAGVEVAEVVQTVSVRAGGTETEQLTFSLAD